MKYLKVITPFLLLVVMVLGFPRINREKASASKDKESESTKIDSVVKVDTPVLLPAPALIAVLTPDSISAPPPIFSRRPNLKIKDSTIVFGLDISKHQGKIDWAIVDTQSKHPIEFIIVRATMGNNGKDAKFSHNFKKAKAAQFIVGAYHYYRPNQNSREQAANYIKEVKLEKGDFVPILDIEKCSKVQGMDSLRAGIKRWLMLVEQEYKVTPILYTGYKFYVDYIKPYKEFNKYPLWVAAYSEAKRDDKVVQNAHIHQFSECVRVPGMKDCKGVDGDDIKREKLPELLIK